MDRRSTVAHQRFFVSRGRVGSRRRPQRQLGGLERLESRALLAADLFTAPAIQWPAVAPLSEAEILPAAVPNDPSFGGAWSLANIGQYAGAPGNDIGATAAWDYTTGSRSVVVAVIDSGIDLNHPDLAANLWVNPGEIAGDGIDNDANGYVDDVHGWDFIDNDAVPQDGYGHGTHVAGIIGAVGNNGIGTTGVSWQVSIMTLRVMDDRGAGSTEAVLAALQYATAMRRDHGIMIVASNNSWDAPAGYSVVFEQLIREHGEAGIMFVAAAGNHATNTDVTPSYPGGYQLSNVLAVASLAPDGSLAYSSNYGATSVDVAAPGTLIQSTYLGGGYGTMSGTSMAAPHVTGTLALLAAARPQITVTEMRAAVLGTATPLASLAGKVAGGRLDARAALASLGVPMVTPPAPVTVVVPPTVAPPVAADLQVAPVAPIAFRDDFATADGPPAAANWATWTGTPGIIAGGVVSRTTRATLLTVRGVTETDVSLRSNADVRRGGSISLVARHDPARGSMLLAELGRVGSRFRVRLLAFDGVRYRLLASRWVSGGNGELQLDAIGGDLKLSFRGRLVVSARTAKVGPGGVGLRLSGTRARAEDFSATRAV